METLYACHGFKCVFRQTIISDDWSDGRSGGGRIFFHFTCRISIKSVCRWMESFTLRGAGEKAPPLCQPSVSRPHVQFLLLHQPPAVGGGGVFWHTATDSFRIITSRLPWNFLISCSLNVNPGVPDVRRWKSQGWFPAFLVFFFPPRACHSPLRQLLFLISSPVICGESICRCFRWGTENPPGRGHPVCFRVLCGRIHNKQHNKEQQ